MSYSWADRACLVTGGSGFGGSHLCARLLGLGAKVYVVDREFPRNSYLALSEVAKQVELISGDIRNLDLLRWTLERYQIDTVFHLAAQAIAPTSNVLPLETLSVNALGTYTVLEAMRTSSTTKRLIFASSGAYYGTTTTDHPLAEEDAPGPAANIYAPSKVAGDVAVRAYAHVFGLKAAVCRFMNTYGPGDTNFSRLVPRAVKNLLTGSSYDFGDRDDGTTRFPYLHIRDMANAYIRLAEHVDRVSGEAFNFDGGVLMSTREMAKMISRLFDGQEREPRFLGAPRDKPVIKSLDIQKAKRLLDWQPATPLEQGLRETIEWYRQFLGKL